MRCEQWRYKNVSFKNQKNKMFFQIEKCINYLFTVFLKAYRLFQCFQMFQQIINRSFLLIRDNVFSTLSRKRGKRRVFQMIIIPEKKYRFFYSCFYKWIGFQTLILFKIRNLFQRLKTCQYDLRFFKFINSF